MKNVMLLFLALAIFACGETTPKEANTITEEGPQTVEAKLVEPAPAKKAEETDTKGSPEKETPRADILGYYTGAFVAKKYNNDRTGVHSNRITIAIESVNTDSVFGKSVVAGNTRPFEGPYQIKEDGDYEVTANEPGDDRYDGVFTFEIRPATKDIRGTWKANNTKLAVSERMYDLEKRAFEYRPDLNLPENVSWADLYDGNDDIVMEAEFLTPDVLNFNPSVQELSKEDVENMYKGDLEIMRNSIYARHGYSFKNRKIRFIFDNYVDWYMPVSTDIRDSLTKLEYKNIALLKRYEEHAEQYYDSFGR